MEQIQLRFKTARKVQIIAGAIFVCSGLAFLMLKKQLPDNPIFLYAYKTACISLFVGGSTLTVLSNFYAYPWREKRQYRSKTRIAYLVLDSVSSVALSAMFILLLCSPTSQSPGAGYHSADRDLAVTIVLAVISIATMLAGAIANVYSTREQSAA